MTETTGKKRGAKKGQTKKKHHMLNKNDVAEIIEKAQNGRYSAKNVVEDYKCSMGQANKLVSFLKNRPWVPKTEINEPQLNFFLNSIEEIAEAAMYDRGYIFLKKEK